MSWYMIEDNSVSIYQSRLMFYKISDVLLTCYCSPVLYFGKNTNFYGARKRFKLVDHIFENKATRTCCKRYH